MRYILDRFEEGTAVVEAEGENGPQWLCLPREDLPACAREGDVLRRAEEGWRVDEAATEARRAALRARFSALGKNAEK